MAVLDPKPFGVSSLIYQKYEEASDPGGRAHLGASEIGQECSRALWYSFRWVGWKHFDGRMLRLFNTGHLAEPRLAADLRKLGIVVHLEDENGQQFHISDFGGHFGGSLDGAALGIPEAPKTWHLLEFKTHNQKSFKNLENNGVEIAKPEHFAQMQIYLHYTGLTRALYLAENKNTSELYDERIKADASIAIKLKIKAERIIFSPRPLAKISEDPTFYKCNWCPLVNQCHYKNEMPRMNCRTCLHSTPKPDGTWYCEHKNKTLTLEDQKAGCDQHLWIPDLIPAEQVDVRSDGVVYEDLNKKLWINKRGGTITEHA